MADKVKGELSRILIVHNHYRIPGGEDTVVANEQKMLKEHGHFVISYSRSNIEIDHFNILQKLLLPFTSIFSLKTYRDVKRLIKDNSIDILHVHNTLSLISPSVYYAAFHYKVPIVQTIHNFRMICPNGLCYRDGHICEDCVEKGLLQAVKHRCYRGSLMQSAIGALILKLHRFLGTYKKINFICLTEFNREKLLLLNKKGHEIVDINKITVRPNISGIHRGAIPWEHRKDQFVYVGRLDQLKGVHIMLEGWSKIKNFDLIICGTGPEEHWMQQYIVEHGMDNVKMLGYVEHNTAINLIAESKGLILLSQWYEGFPMVLSESWAVGTPVIGSDVGNVGSLIIDGQNGWTVKDIQSFIDTCKAVGCGKKSIDFSSLTITKNNR